MSFGGGEGAEVIYALRNNDKLSNLVLSELEKEGQVIRKAYQRRLPSNTSKDYYFMQRNTGITQPITVEYGFLDNANDANKLKNNYIDYAEAVVRAVSQYIGLNDASDNVYIVKSGDSLWSIAKKLNVSVEELKAANNLNSNLLQIGQILNIPTSQEPITGEYVIYTVKSGDSLYQIAQRYDISVNDIVNYNGLSTTSLSIGQKLLIPVEKSQTENYDTYIVKSGDTLYKIANNYNTTPNELMDINNLSTNILSIGQKLLIPKQNTTIPSNQIEYTVKSGDNLYSIANRYGISVNELKNYNNLTNNNLSIGQKIIIPMATETITYVVKSGDNLYSIASRYNTTVDEIKRKNNLTNNNLSIGQILLI